MRYQLVNGESVEIERLDNEQDPADLNRVYVRFAVAFHGLNGELVHSYTARYAELASDRRAGHLMKHHGPERIVMGMRFHPPINTGDPERAAALYELFTHLRRHRLGSMHKLH